MDSVLCMDAEAFCLYKLAERARLRGDADEAENLLKRAARHSVVVKNIGADNWAAKEDLRKGEE
jgi:hypothetical protein